MDHIYATHPQQIQEVGIDWLTATIKPGKRADITRGRVKHWQGQREEDGFTKRPWRNPFYQGVSCGGVTFGERNDDFMLTLSGDSARRWAATAITWADNISRLDVQATLWDPDISHDWAGYVDKLAGLLPEVKSEHLETRLINTRPRGRTSYIGSGNSDRMLRLYDKHAESDGVYPLGSWRWEVQYRKARAYSAARQLLTGAYLAQSCLDCVCGAYQSYLIDLPTLCLPSNWKEQSFRTPSDDERRLLWLKRCIAPMIERLREMHNTDVVLNALGLGDVVDTLEGNRAAMVAADEVLADVEHHLITGVPASDPNRLN